MTMNKFNAGDLFPSISLPTFDGNTIEVGQPSEPATWRLVVVYRGKHCPLCTRYLNELEGLKAKFLEIGVDIVAVSADSKEQVAKHMEQISVSFPIAYGLSVEQMQTLGLYISEPRSEKETDHLFAEPGLFVVNDQGRVQIIDISNGPFVRPELNVLLSGIAFIRNPENNYPIRGTYQPSK
ncbi:AhpC/TSA family protein [Vibrio alfacsensis]|uniref:AhpC/TSA family protein n=1 Tax=Vibrio alfacsensis TaxID=1074311 RepID=A0ABN5PNG1_9VIBR|nr:MULTISPECIES: peroxiredoxin-like family protein [Vibrio]AXY03561.1 AhpC/TSA family protein [Vibrio alfacsensis]WQE78927.1 peroxiredoxin-like family protein [Vibrio alfacsensis]CAE6936664.1 AhpC/TSA family [Vibrio sp. B1REV9]